MSGTWGQPGIVQSFQQIVHAVQAVLDAKLPLQNANHVLAAQRADAILRPRTRVEACLQFCFAFTRQLRLAARLGLGLDVIDSAVAVSVDPVLHAAAGPIQSVGDVERFLSLKSQSHGAIAIASQGIAFVIDQLLKSLKVPRVAFRHQHRRPP